MQSEVKVNVNPLVITVAGANGFLGYDADGESVHIGDKVELLAPAHEEEVVGEVNTVTGPFVFDSILDEIFVPRMESAGFTGVVYAGRRVVSLTHSRKIKEH